MAKPPEPLDELIPAAQAIVIAKVVEIIQQGPPPPKVERKHPSEVDLPIKRQWQKVKLSVERVLKGVAGQELVLEKPEGAYTLDVGESGPFFVADGKIIGRYGPITHRLEKIEAALKRE